MNYLDIIIFIIVLFVYLHIYYHFKTSSDMEIYTLENLMKERLEEICNIKQPLKFSYPHNDLNQCNLHFFEKNLNNQGEINIRDTKVDLKETQYMLPFKTNDAIKVLKQDTTSSYISEKNHYFLDEVNMSDNYNNLSSFLKPPMTVSTKHDFCSGSKNSHTPLRHNIIYRNFYYVSSGKVTIKLIPPKDAFLLHGHKDYDLFEFSSPINPWNVSKEYVNDFQNVNHMDIELTEGDILYIPAYWWYSIRYDEISSLCVFQYKTFMNVLAIAPELIMYFLQTQNTTHKTEKTIDDILVNTTKNNNETSSKKENVSKNKDKKD